MYQHTHEQLNQLGQFPNGMSLQTCHAGILRPILTSSSLPSGTTASGFAVGDPYSRLASNLKSYYFDMAEYCLARHRHSAAVSDLLHVRNEGTSVIGNPSTTPRYRVCRPLHRYGDSAAVGASATRILENS